MTTINDDDANEKSGDNGIAISADLRKLRILDKVRADGRIDASEASHEFDVSIETIRRDLRDLEGHGLVRRAYGVAYPIETTGYETSLQSREGDSEIEKRRIATEAARHLGDAESVFIDEGYLPTLLATALPLDRKLTVVTASLPVASILAPRETYNVILLGGRVRGITLATVDHWVSKMLSSFVIDLAFVGANGISRNYGLTTQNPAVAEVKSTAVLQSRRRIFVGAYPKFTSTCLCYFADVSSFDLIITDKRLPVNEAVKYEALGPRVIRV